MQRRKYIRPFIEIGAQVTYTPRSRPEIAYQVQVVSVLNEGVMIEYAGGQRELVLPRELAPGRPIERVVLKRPRKRGPVTLAQVVERFRQDLQEIGCDLGDDKTRELLRKHGVG